MKKKPISELRYSTGRPPLDSRVTAAVYKLGRGKQRVLVIRIGESILSQLGWTQDTLVAASLFMDKRKAELAPSADFGLALARKSSSHTLTYRQGVTGLLGAFPVKEVVFEVSGHTLTLWLPPAAAKVSAGR